MGKRAFEVTVAFIVVAAGACVADKVLEEGSETQGLTALVGQIIPASATASAIYQGNVPALAFDGDPNTIWSSGGFPTQWITLDLGGNYSVSMIRLLVHQSPSGATSHRIFGGVTSLVMSQIGSYSGTTQTGQWLTVNTTTSTVRFIIIQTVTSPSWVGWAEIQVLGVAPTPIVPIFAMASATYNGYPAANAIDGNTGTHWDAGGFAAQWIQLDLGAYYDVTQVRLNVIQSPSGKTRHVILGGHTTTDLSAIGATAGQTSSNQWLTVNTTNARWIRYLRVLTTESPSWVGWNEIQVFGNGVSMLPITSVTASSTNPGQSASLAIDGNTNTYWSSTGFPTQWILVDLGASYDVAGVQLTVQQSPNGQTSHVIYGGDSTSNLGPIGGYSGVTQSGQVLDVPVDGRSVRYIKVQTVESPSWVGWREVRVYGTSLVPLGAGQRRCADGLTGNNTLVKTGYFGESFTGAAGGDYIPEIADHSNISWVTNWSATDFSYETQKLQQAAANGMKVVLYTYGPFFTYNDSNQIVPRTDYQTRWDQYAVAIQPYINSVYAFYPLDEPYSNLVAPNPQQYLETVASTIKATFPNANLGVTFSTQETADIFHGVRNIPAEYDWIGFDCYGSWTACGPSYAIPELSAMLRPLLSPSQKMFLVPDAVRPDPPSTAPSWAEKIALVYRANNYYQLGLGDSAITGLNAFVWQRLPNPGFYGVRDMSLVQEKYRSIGRCVKQ